MKQRYPFSVRNLEVIRDDVQSLAYEDEDGELDPKDLCGACAIASLWVFQYLKERKHSPIFVMVEENHCAHCWVRCKGFTIDLTATQFDITYPDVLVIQTQDEHLYPCFQNVSVLVEIEDIIEIEKKLADWPDGQNPFKQ